MFGWCFRRRSSHSEKETCGRSKVLVVMGALTLVSLTVVLIVYFTNDGFTKAYSAQGQIRHSGYEFIERAYIKEVQAELVVYRHLTSKTEVMTLIPDDHTQDSVFGASFRTIPYSDNGVAHVLEHSVLDGSEKYPTKDPFNQLDRGSLSTFLNAFTFDDRTVYAVASRNSADFSNLVSVYLDAVFRPRAVTDEGRWILRQEGWRIERDEEDESLYLTGVVLSEMKGAYSDPDEIIHRYAQNLLFPKTSYRFDSGGEPSKIPQLNHNDFTAFYKKFYHPTNAQLFFYGPVEDVKDGMDKAHKYFAQVKEARSDIRHESRVEWQDLEYKEPVRQVQKYQNTDNNDYRVLVSWVINERAMDTKTELAWFVINELLLGSSTSTLRKALKESRLGNDVIGDGIEFWLQQWTFHVGMQGIETPENIQLVEELILDTLESVQVNGFSSDDVASAMNTVEFQLRELSTGKEPRGIVLLLSAIRKWNYDRDPRSSLEFETALQQLKETVTNSGSEIFVSLIKSQLAINHHRVITELHPDATVEQEREREEQRFLQQLEEQLTNGQFEQLLGESENLAQVQQTSDSPEVLATVPTLSLSDIDKSGDEYPIETFVEKDIQVISHPIHSSSGILYVDFGLDMSTITLDDLPLVPFLARLMLESGTATMNDVQLERKIGMQTGGIDFTPLIETVRPTGAQGKMVPDGRLLQTKLFLRGKCTEPNIQELFALLAQILFDGGNFTEAKALTILKEMIAEEEAALSSDGDHFASRRVGSRYSVQGYAYEQLHGISQLQALNVALETGKADWGLLEAKLNRMKRDLVKGHRNGMVLNLTGYKYLLSRTQEEALHFVTNGIPSNQDATPFPNFNEEVHPWVAQAEQRMALTDEGIATATGVSHVDKGGVIYSPGELIDGSAAVATEYLSRGYLYENLRLKGGAYGASAFLRDYSGVFEFKTYRDPNVAETTKVFDGAATALLEGISASETLPLKATDAITGTIGRLDGSAPQPDELGWNSLRQFLKRETPEMRQAWRDQILATTRQDYIDFANRLSEWRDTSVAVVSSREALQDAQEQGVILEPVTWKIYGNVTDLDD